VSADAGPPAQGRARRGIARAATLLVSLTAVSQLLGFVRDAVIAAVFGAGAALDAYLVAQGVMNLVLALVAGALARAVVPPVSRAAERGERLRADRTVQTVLTIAVLVLVAASLLVFAGAEAVVAVLAPGFDEPTAELAVRLTRIVLVAAVFVAGTDILAAAAQAHGRFFGSGVQGVPFNLVMIAAAVWAGPLIGVEALAIGFVVGSAVRMLVQVPAIRAAGLRVRPRLALRDPDVREVLRLTPALLVGSAVVNVNTLVDRAVGSSQGEGVITALNLGFRVVNLADSLLVATVVAALYPAFSAAGLPERRAELRELVDRAMRTMLLVLLPVVVVLVVAARPIVQLAFGRGDFDAAAVAATSTAVVFYAASAVGLAVRSTASRACLAVGDSRTPTVVALVSMALNVVGDLTLGLAFGIAGIALATSLSLAAGAVLTVVLLARRHGAVSAGPVAASAVRLSLAASAGGLLAAVVVRWVDPDVAGAVGSLTALAVVGGTVTLSYLLLLRVVRAPELADLRRLPVLRTVLDRRPGR
jgi:putative peptidoglycan lipid II flippase